MAITLKVIVPPHPLIAHWLTILRNHSTPPPLYATALEELGRWITYESLREWLPFRKEEIWTLHGKTEGAVIEANVPLIALPILPAGIEIWQGARKVIPNAELCLGTVPDHIESNAGIIMFIDQIASGERILKFLQLLQKRNVESNRLRVITIVSSHNGLKNIGESIPDLTIHCACIDEKINEKNEIIPGIGNPIQRLSPRIAPPN